MDVELLHEMLAMGAISVTVDPLNHQFRDPWGNPYIISLDLSYDEHTRDAISFRFCRKGGVNEVEVHVGGSGIISQIAASPLTARRSSYPSG